MRHEVVLHSCFYITRLSIMKPICRLQSCSLVFLSSRTVCSVIFFFSSSTVFFFLNFNKIYIKLKTLSVIKFCLSFLN